MALVRCPQCGRVADGINCFACGYEWEDDNASQAPSDPDSTQAFTKEDPPPSEESAPVVIEEPAPARTVTPPPITIPEVPSAVPSPEPKSGVTQDLSDVLSDLDLPKAPPVGSDSLDFDLEDVANAMEASSTPAPEPTPAPAASDPLSIAFAMDGLDLDAGGPSTPDVVPSAPEPAPPPQLPDDFDVEFGDVPSAPTPTPPEPDSLGSSLDDLEAELDLDFDDDDKAIVHGDPLDDEDALADVNLDTGELDADDLLAAMSVPSDPDELDVDLESGPEAQIPVAVDDRSDDSIAAALEAFGAPEIPDAMKLEDQDVAEDDFDPFAEKDAGPAAVPAPPPTPPPIPADDSSGVSPGFDFDDAEHLSADDAIDNLGEAPAAPAPPAPPSDEDIPYRDRLMKSVSTLAQTLEQEGRFDDAALLYEVFEFFKIDG